MTLAPGQTFTYERSWHGLQYRTYELPDPGIYAVVGGLHDSSGYLAVPPAGARLHITIGDSSGVPVARTTWGAIKARAE
jgi:hypothetical protein